MPVRRIPFTVLEPAHKVHSCDRCRRPMRTGEKAVALREPHAVSFRHAGRVCPPALGDRHPFLR
jgi:hypothetical protein